MTEKADIGLGRLVYSCNCGWIDLGHADAKSRRQNVGAESLWKQITTAADVKRYAVRADSKAVLLSQYEEATGSPGPQNQFDGFIVNYRQEQGIKKFGIMVRAGEDGTYVVKSGLTSSEQKAVALAIFMEITFAFESMQGSFPYRIKSGPSSFSQEDLVSNLIGFYSVVEPALDYISLCMPVTQKASEEIWDAHGAVGANKNQTFEPVLYECDECKTAARKFPSQLQSIQPVKKGSNHFDFAVQTKMSSRWR